MLRRRVLTIGLAGLLAVLVGGCGGGESSSPEQAGRNIDDDRLPSPTYDPVTYSPPKIDVEQLRKLYIYDQKAPLDLVQTSSRTENGLRVEDMTFTGTKGTTVPLYVISPSPGKGKLPAILFAPDAGATREALMREAVDLAKLGVVSAIVGIGFKPIGDPQNDSNMVINAVTAQRRAFDLLSKRDDVDVTRLAMVGFGWGAAQAQIVSGIDTRMLAVVSVSCGGRWSRSAYRLARPGDAPTYLDALTRFDGMRYVTVGGKRSLLLQFGKQDSGVSMNEADELAIGTVAAKERMDYEAAHDLTAVPTAAADRRTFLHRVLRLKQPLSGSSQSAVASAGASAAA